MKNLYLAHNKDKPIGVRQEVREIVRECLDKLDIVVEKGAKSNEITEVELAVTIAAQNHLAALFIDL